MRSVRCSRSDPFRRRGHIVPRAGITGTLTRDGGTTRSRRRNLKKGAPRPPCRLPLSSPAVMPERVTILGDGAMATVCSILLTQGGHAVTMWGAFEESIERLMQNRENSRLLPGAKVPPGVRLTANDTDCFDGATMVLSAIPTQFARGVWERLGPRV